MTRNQNYEQRQRDKGLEKITLWVPSNHKAALAEMAQATCEHPHLEPFLLRDTVSNRVVSPRKLNQG